MRIAIDCRMIGSGGIGSYISELIPYLIEENDTLLLGSHEQCMDFVRLENVEFCFCDVKPFSKKEMFNFPSDILARINSYDVYFTPYCNIPNGITIPVFSTIHDVVFLDVPGLTSFFGKLGRKMIYQRAINKSNTIFTVSKFSKNRIRANLRCKKNIVITYNSTPKYLRENSNEESENAIAKEDFVLFVGNIKKHKGLKTLLEAYEIALKNGFSSKLVIVGNADNFRTGDDETVRKLESLPKDKIEFTGKISNQMLKENYQKAKFLVQPSLYEGFGMPPLEAMTLETPVLLSDIEVFKEIYEGFPVQFFKCGDANDLAEKMLSMKTDAIDLGALKEKYSYKKSAETILEQFRKVYKK